MRSLLRVFGRRHLVAFVVALSAGLALAVAVGALASSGGGDRAVSGRSPARAEAARSALPDARAMRVFQRAAVANDALPPAARAVVEQFSSAPVADAVNPGAGVMTSSRRALVDAGSQHASLYLVPTQKGSLCMVWVPDVYGGGCTQGFVPGSRVVFLRGSSFGTAYVWGILRADVKSVSALVGGAIRPVSVGQSAFFYQGSSLPDALVLTLANGTTQRVPVAAMYTLG
jgi:hypothetical protein